MSLAKYPLQREVRIEQYSEKSIANVLICGSLMRPQRGLTYGLLR